MTDSKGLWIDILFESMTMASIFNMSVWSFCKCIHTDTQDLSHLKDFCTEFNSWEISEWVQSLAHNNWIQPYFVVLYWSLIIHANCTIHLHPSWTKFRSTSVFKSLQRRCLTQEEEREDAALKPEECTGKHVCIEYDGRAYPGFVEDADLAQVYVSCMHSVGKEMLNCFYWPRLFRDLIWYDDQILAIIPKPHLKTWHNKSLWSWS